MVRRKNGRFTIDTLGEFYEDFLTVDAWINNRTTATQANSLLCAKLMQRQAEIRDRVEYLAKKRAIPAEELGTQILSGTAQKKSLAEEAEELTWDIND